MSESFDARELHEHSAEHWEQAHTGAMTTPLFQSPAELVTSTWDPLTVDARLLPLAAYQYGVNLYEDIWSLDTRRRWIADNWKFLSIRGTVAGIREALRPSGYELQEYIRPPAGFYASPELTQAEMDIWVHLMPELRITYGARQGLDNGQFFADVDFADDGFAGFDDANALLGNVAFIRRNGVDQSIYALTRTKSFEERTRDKSESYSSIGLSTLGFFSNESAANDEQYVGAFEIEPEIFTISLDETYVREREGLDLTTVIPSLTPIDPRFEIESDEGFWDFQTFANEAVAGVDFAGIEDAQYLLARRIFLLDPKIQAPRNIGVSFANYDRAGLPLRTVELMIDLNTTATPADGFCEVTIGQEFFAIPEDTSHQDRAIRAVEAARGHLDRTLVRFDSRRPLIISDMIDEGTPLGLWVNNSL